LFVRVDPLGSLKHIKHLTVSLYFLSREKIQYEDMYIKYTIRRGYFVMYMYYSNDFVLSVADSGISEQGVGSRGSGLKASVGPGQGPGGGELPEADKPLISDNESI
jgi:hypothetical protein